MIHSLATTPLLVVNMKNISLPVTRTKVYRRNWSKYHPSDFNETFNEEWDYQWSGNSDRDVDHLTAKLNSLMDKFCPLRAIRLNRPNDTEDQKLEAMKKKRKRLRKKFNKEKDIQNRGLLEMTIKQLNRGIKQKIAEVPRNQIKTRLEGGNLKSFWSAVGQLEGKKFREPITLVDGNNIISDPEEIAEKLATFFDEKVLQLSNSYGANDYRVGPSNLQFTLDKVKNATSFLKPKLCKGEDGIPMRIIKDFANQNPALVVELID